jgi:glutaminyl-peptide cyclotransferase
MAKSSNWKQYVVFGLIGLFILSLVGPQIMDVISGMGSSSNHKPSTITPKKAAAMLPTFSADSTYIYTERQVKFGPRVPNSPAHDNCRKWIVSTFKRFGADVVEQKFDATAYDGKVMHGTNIIARYNPTVAKRVVLSCHWDSRHVADQDADKANHKKPILGADDGGSTVGTLLEIARQLQHQPIANMGVDIILFDLEDHGEPSDYKPGDDEDQDSWCLGSQYWAAHPHAPNYSARFGINIDMAGAKNARFTREAVSMQVAPNIMNKVWKFAQDQGFANYFDDELTGGLIDDHMYVNKILHTVPMIDIINRPADSQTGFGHYWHTQKDDMSNIDKSTLFAVGTTLLGAVYNEANDSF